MPSTPSWASTSTSAWRSSVASRTRSKSLFQKGEVHGTTHLYSGQEAGAVGVCSVLAESDRVAGTYRGHGHALALGVDPEALMAELLGRETGVCAGRAGSMNVIDLAHGLIGCFGIVGGSIAAATGVALAFQRRGVDDVAVAFFGEGTTNQAYFAECLNFARVLGLPAVFVCENNRYMEFTPIEDVTAGEIRARAETLGCGPRPSTAWTCGRCARRRGARWSTRAPAAARPSWRRSPIASSATRAATPAPTASPASSTRCASVIRWWWRGPA